MIPAQPSVPASSAEPPKDSEDSRAAQAGKVLAPGRRTVTFMLWAVFFITYVQLIFVVSWTPSLLEFTGATPAQVGASLLLANAGSVVGLLAGGILILHLGPIRIMLGAQAVIAAALLVIGAAIASSFAIVSVGLFTFGTGMGLLSAAMVAMAAEIYPQKIRGTAMGLSYGAGRLGSIVAAALGGILYTAGLSVTTLYVLAASLAVPLTVSVVTIAKRRQAAMAIAD